MSMTLSPQNAIMVHTLHASQQAVRSRTCNVKRCKARLGIALDACSSFLFADIARLRRIEI
jgi:hypothetical protein